MKYLSLIILSTILFSGYRSSKNEMNSSSKTASAGWQKLFDGKTTAGWHSYGKTEVGQAWKVSDGALYLDAKNKKEVENYLFILRNKYGIWKDGEYIWNNLVQSSKTGQIYFIDFGNIPWFTTVSNTKWNINQHLYATTNLKEE